MAHVYLKGLNRFLGPKVGLRQKGVLKRSKFFGPYIEHLLLFYWIVATILVLSFRPVEPSSDGASSLVQAAAFFTLLTINVVSDAISLLWTKRCIALLDMPSVKITLRRLFAALSQDLIVAVGLMLLVQFISNGLYAIQIGRPQEWVTYMLDWKTAFKPYGSGDFQFPGQLVITCTTYIPSFSFYFTCLLILALRPFYSFLIWTIGIISLEPTTENMKCTQVNFIGTLIAVGGAAAFFVKLLI